jgi:hypothetical protein
MTKTVKDVSSHEFVRSYAAHLKRSGKVWQRGVHLPEVYVEAGVSDDLIYGLMVYGLVCRARGGWLRKSWHVLLGNELFRLLLFM